MDIESMKWIALICCLFAGSFHVTNGNKYISALLFFAAGMNFNAILG